MRILSHIPVGIVTIDLASLAINSLISIFKVLHVDGNGVSSPRRQIEIATMKCQAVMKTDLPCSKFKLDNMNGQTGVLHSLNDPAVLPSEAPFKVKSLNDRSPRPAMTAVGAGTRFPSSYHSLATAPTQLSSFPTCRSSSTRGQCASRFDPSRRRVL